MTALETWCGPRALGGAGFVFDVGLSIAVDGSGNSYVTGDYTGTATNPTIFGLGEPNEIRLISRGDRDIFLAKFDSAGSLVWAKSAARGSGPETAWELALDGFGNIHMAGQYTGSATDPTTFGPGAPNETQLISAGDRDIFVAQFDSTGNLLWVKNAGGTGADAGRGIAMDNSGNSYVTGFYSGTATFGSGEPNETQLTGTAANHIFIAKFAGDPDQDNVSNLFDNCLTVSNPDQTDVNGDGYGDACVSPDVTIPPSSSFGSNPIIGSGTTVSTGISIGDDAEIGSNVTLNRNITAGDDLTIGDGTSVDQGANFGDNVTIGVNVVIGRNAVIGSGVVIGDNTVVGQGAIIGANAQVGSNVKVGSFATVAVGAVVPNGTGIGAKQSYP